MKHFIAFQKRKGLYLEPVEGIAESTALVHQINHELMRFGYVLSNGLFTALSTRSETVLGEVYNDLMTNINKIVGDGIKHQPIYRNFPQSVVELSYFEFARNAIFHYWSWGTWRPEDEKYINREFKIEPVKYKSVALLSKDQFESIFTDILYSGSSISPFDKKVVDYFISNNTEFDFSKITFKETAAYVGKRLLDKADIEILPTKDAVNVLRIYSAYCNGDEGLKENTKFKNPSGRQVKILVNTLENCYNLEESFKIYREKFLRVLYYLNPLTKRNQKLYPNLYNYTNSLRNNPKELRTFNSRVEELLGKKDIAVLELLKKRPGTFVRRLDHTVRLFGVNAIESWLQTKPNLSALITAYNHFTDRDKKQEGRGVVLASQSKSNVVTYDALEPLDAKLVSSIKGELLDRIKKAKLKELAGKKVYIHRSLYYRPLVMNNRASSLSLDGKANGTVEVLPAGKTVRMYAHWHGRYDIDLSGLVLTSDSEVMKVGWNAYHHFEKQIVYSGDNTGFADENAEYLDIKIDALPANIEWIITEARIYRGPKDFASFNPKTKVGWMLREHPTANTHWLPETTAHSVVLENKATTAYLMALHVPTRSIVYLDLAMGTNQVSTAEDAVKMRMFLESFVTLDKGESEIEWKKINQGHILNALSETLVDKAEEADLIFDENTTSEMISAYYK